MDSLDNTFTKIYKDIDGKIYMKFNTSEKEICSTQLCIKEESNSNQETTKYKMIDLHVLSNE